MKDFFYSTLFADIVLCLISLLMAWDILLRFIEDPYIALISPVHFAMSYEIGFKKFYRINRKITFFVFFLFPSIFILSFIMIRLIVIW
jgi:hypothetical protein